MDEVMNWFREPATYDNPGDWILAGMLIALLCIVFAVAMFGKKEQ